MALGPQTRAEFTELAGAAVAAAAFAAPAGAVVGPVQSDLGWHVVKVESIRREGGKSLAAARAEIAARLTDEKRKGALADLVARVEDALADGSNFAEAAALGKLTVSETPLITATGAARDNPSFRLPPELAPALRSGFELTADDEPVVETLADGQGYVLVAPARIVPASPAPLATIRAPRRRATGSSSRRPTGPRPRPALSPPRHLAACPWRARWPKPELHCRRSAKSARGASRCRKWAPTCRRRCRMLFTLGAGRSRLVADPQQRGFSIVKVNRIVPGNALNQPTLIGRVQNDFQQAVEDEYARQFLSAIRGSVGVQRKGRGNRAPPRSGSAARPSAPRLTRALTLPTRSPFVPAYRPRANNGVAADAHRQAA